MKEEKLSETFLPLVNFGIHRAFFVSHGVKFLSEKKKSQLIYSLKDFSGIEVTRQPDLLNSICGGKKKVELFLVLGLATDPNENDK